MEHLTSPPKGKVGTSSSVSSFNHGRAPMSSLRQLDAPKHIIGQTIMPTEPPVALKSSSDSTQHSELYYVIVSMV